MKLTYIIKRPIITERSMAMASQSEYTFEVALGATKGQIKKAVEDYFNVEVVSVRTSISKGKTKRAGKLRKTIEFASKKKAIIKIKEGQKLTFFEEQA